MNIVDLVISESKTEADSCLFEINCILADPTKDNAKERLHDLLTDYHLLSERVVSAERLKSQMENTSNENQGNSDNT
tara:strand:- start:720 stop:950 length:231 start_codon:yes stop_codon:yes gene_type:complete